MHETIRVVFNSILLFHVKNLYNYYDVILFKDEERIDGNNQEDDVIAKSQDTISRLSKAMTEMDLKTQVAYYLCFNILAAKIVLTDTKNCFK